MVEPWQNGMVEFVSTS